jgi:mannose-6-phosphate isomerase-like protein (cupin superfamily)
MLSFLRGPDVKRTKVSHLTTFTMENGRSSVSFHNDPNLSSQQASISFTLPPANPGPDPKDNSIMIPPFHAHPKQQEIFHVTKGTALFLVNQEKVAKAAGEELVIPRGVYHKFTNQSTTEPMTLEAHYDPPELVREERFFRNLCGYLQDVTQGGAGMLESASTAQLALFAWEADMPICEPGMFISSSS